MDLPKTAKEAKASGSMHYFTGKPCIHGHVCARYSRTWMCVECSRLSHERWAAENPEKKLESGKKSWHANLEARHAGQTVYRLANLEKIAAQKKAWSEKNADHKRAKRREWGIQKRDMDNSAKYAWEKRNRDYRRTVDHQRRNAEGKFTRDDMQKMFSEQCGRCKSCDADISSGYEIDHIMPISKGGTNWPSNLQLLCKPCNRSKGSKHPADWVPEKAKAA